MPFLTVKQTGGLLVFALRQGDRYLAVKRSRGIPAWIPVLGGMGSSCKICPFNIQHLALAVGQRAGETWQEHASLILLACCEGRLFEWLGKLKEK